MAINQAVKGHQTQVFYILLAFTGMAQRQAFYFWMVAWKEALFRVSLWVITTHHYFLSTWKNETKNTGLEFLPAPEVYQELNISFKLVLLFKGCTADFLQSNILNYETEPPVKI